MKSFSSFMAGLLAGATLGGVIALLYAPQSGRDTREKIKSKFDDLEKEIGNLKARAGQKTDKARKDLADRIAELQREIDSLSKEAS